jgi:hypothetical protein
VSKVIEDDEVNMGGSDSEGDANENKSSMQGSEGN